MNVKSLIEKIELLEIKLGNKTTNKNIQPFVFNSSNVIEVQKAGKRIAEHLGLSNLIFVITYSSQEKNTAGHINLNFDNEVFIEVDSMYRNDYEIVLAILAHEICHKLLYLNNIKLYPDIENEMLTDAATIYTGLGKLSLNGCEKQNVTSKTEPTYNGNITTTTTTTFKIGYMNRIQFAFIYKFICKIRKINQNDMFATLNSDVISEIQKISSQYNKYFNDTYFHREFSNDLLSNSLNNEILMKQKEFAKLLKNTRIIQTKILNYAEEYYKRYNKNLKNNLDVFRKHTQNTSYNNQLQYVKNVLFQDDLINYVEINKNDKELLNLSNSFEKFINFHNRILPNLLIKNAIDFLKTFQCPICHKEMKVSAVKIVKINCPKCNHSFIVDTGTSEMEKALKIKKQSVFKRMITKVKSIFTKK